jgi:phospholipid/cholesterol/gamma-HCH transport system substrate-binding protein
MNKKIITRNFKIGALVLTSIFLLFFGLNYLKGKDVFTADNTYYVHFDKVDGVQKSIPVNIKGYKVGQVADIIYEPSNPQPFTLVLLISKKMKLPVSSRIELYDDGLLGSKGLRVVLDEKEIALGQLYKSGDTIPTFTTGGLMSKIENELLAKIGGVVAQADSLLGALRLLAESSQLKNTLAALETTTASLSATSVQLNKVMSNDVPVLFGNLNTMTSDLKQFSGNVKTIDLAATVDTLNSTINNLKNISEKINSSESSLGLLMNDKQLYNNLQNVTDNANKLVIDLKENPKRYVHFSVW